MTRQEIEEIIVIGSGNWGLALACLFSKSIRTRVWTVDADMAACLNANREKPGNFYEHRIPDSIVIEEKYSGSFHEGSTLFVVAVPSGQIERVARELGRVTVNPSVLSVSKGFDAQQQCTLSQLIKREIPGSVVAVLSGPTIAEEVAEGQPTRAVLACDDLLSLVRIKKALDNDVISFEVSRNPDHHEVCAALKGIVAIAVGLADGLKLGANVQGIIMVEGIREMGVVASFFGIPHSSAFGLSGAGDLIATCISPSSRNRRLGSYLGQGKTLDGALEEVGMTVEGVAMSLTVETLWSLDVSIPLFHFVNGVINGRCDDIRGGLSAMIKGL